MAVEVTKFDVPHRDLIWYYVERESRKGKEFPTSFPNRPQIDVNDLDEWFRDNGYKEGVIPGFRSWVLVKMSSRELAECAILGSLPRRYSWPSQKLGDLIPYLSSSGWVPDSTDRDWFHTIKSGQPIGTDQALIARPALGSENGSVLYIEDGTGRATWYMAQAEHIEDAVHVYVGYNPDPDSAWLRSPLHLGGKFISNGDDYRDIHRILGRFDRPGLPAG